MMQNMVRPCIICNFITVWLIEPMYILSMAKHGFQKVLARLRHFCCNIKKTCKVSHNHFLSVNRRAGVRLPSEVLFVVWSWQHHLLSNLSAKLFVLTVGQPMVTSAVRAPGQRLILRTNICRMVHAADPALIHPPLTFWTVSYPMISLTKTTGVRGWDAVSVRTLIQSVWAAASVAFYVQCRRNWSISVEWRSL